MGLVAAKARLLKPSRDSRRLNAASRSFNSNKMKITRTKIACLNWPENSNKRSRPTRSKLRKLKRLPLSTRPNTARPNKSLKKPRSEAKWLEPLSPLPALLPLVCKCSKVKDFAPASSSSKHERENNKKLAPSIELLKNYLCQIGTRRELPHSRSSIAVL